jgi:uncharacterized membrane protein YhaH (DUF805 family)
MFDALFGFGGHLGRLAYLGWSIALVGLAAVVGVATAVISIPLIMVFPPLGVLAALPLVVFSVWSSLALMTKRIRDIGLPPLAVIGAVFLVQLIDTVAIARLTDMRFFAPFEYSTPLGAFVTAAFTVFLLLWPSEDLPSTGAPSDARDAADPYGRMGRRDFGRPLR